MTLKGEVENKYLGITNKDLYLKKYQWWVPYFDTKADLKFFKRFMSENYTYTSLKIIYKLGLILFPLYLFYEVFFSSFFNMYSRENGYNILLASIRMVVQGISLFFIWGILPPIILILLKSKIPCIPAEEEQLIRKSAPWIFIMISITLFQFPILLFSFIEGWDFLRLLVPVFIVSIFLTTVLFPKYTWFHVIESFSIKES